MYCDFDSHYYLACKGDRACNTCYSVNKYFIGIKLSVSLWSILYKYRKVVQLAKKVNTGLFN